MTVIDHNGIEIIRSLAERYHSEHPELVEVSPLYYIHPENKDLLANQVKAESTEIQARKTEQMRRITDILTGPDYMHPILMTEIPTELYNRLDYLGLIPSDVRSTHVGQSDYSSKLIQPWTIFLDHPDLNYMECDIIKRVLRTNTRDSRKQDLTKCKHIIDELIRQIDTKEQHD